MSTDTGHGVDLVAIAIELKTLARLHGPHDLFCSHVAQCIGERLACQLDAAVGQAAAAMHHVGHLLGAALQAGDQLRIPLGGAADERKVVVGQFDLDRQHPEVLADPADLDISCTVDGETMQHGRLFLAGDALKTYYLLRQYELFAPLFPQVATLLTPAGNSPFERFLELALINTDERVAADLPVTPAFFYAALLWGVVEKRSRDFGNESSLPPQDTLMLAMNEAIDTQIRTIAIPRRFTTDVRDIWLLQDRLPRRSGKRAERLLGHPKFRAAFDFLELRSRVDGRLKELVQWWQEYQHNQGGEVEHHHAAPQPRHDCESEGERKPRRRRRRGPRRPKDAQA